MLSRKIFICVLLLFVIGFRLGYGGEDQPVKVVGKISSRIARYSEHGEEKVRFYLYGKIRNTGTTFVSPEIIWRFFDAAGEEIIGRYDFGTAIYGDRTSIIGSTDILAPNHEGYFYMVIRRDYDGEIASYSYEIESEVVSEFDKPKGKVVLLPESVQLSNYELIIMNYEWKKVAHDAGFFHLSLRIHHSSLLKTGSRRN